MSNYKRGHRPEGFIIGRFSEYVGNEFNGYKAVGLIVSNTKGMWVCVPQNDTGDFCSYITTGSSQTEPDKGLVKRLKLAGL